MRWITGMVLLMAMAWAQNASVSVQNGWIRVVPQIRDTAAYFTLVNSGDRPMRLVGGQLEVATMVMPMMGTTEIREVNGIRQEVKGMKGVKYLEVPARGKLELKPGGDHLMLMGLKRTLREGEKLGLELRFEDGTRLRVILPVEAR